MSGEMDKHLLKEAAAAFATDGEAISCQRYGSGHINDTSVLREKHPYISSEDEYLYLPGSGIPYAEY